MHIPDGFIDAKTALATGAIAATGLSVALASVRRRIQARRIPLIGLAAAFVFAAQMLNFPVAGGTSGSAPFWLLFCWAPVRRSWS